MARRKQARPKTQADSTYNARRRYYRAAERNLKKAESESGATAARYRQLAQQNLENALATYGENVNQANISKPIQRISESLNFDISQFQFSKSEERKSKVVKRSTNFLERELEDPEIRREREARELLNNERIGRRIIGGLVDIWRPLATTVDKYGFEKVDKSAILPAIKMYFGTDSLADIVDRLEEVVGSDLYSLEGNVDDIYEYVKVVIQSHVIDNSLVQ